MTTAMDKWAEQDDNRQNEGEELERDNRQSHEDEDHGPTEYEQVEARASSVQMNDEEAAHQAKKEKDKKIIKAVGAGVGVFALAVLSLSFFSRENSNAVKEYSEATQAEIVSPIAQPVNAPVAPVIDDLPPLNQAPALDVASTELPVTPVPASQERVPELAASPATTTASVLASASDAVQQSSASQMLAATNDATMIAALRGENNTLRTENTTLRAELETQRALSSRLQASLDARTKESQKPVVSSKPATQGVTPAKAAPPAVPQNKKVAEPAKTVTERSKPASIGAVVEQQVLQDTKQTPALPSPQTKGAKVRAEFTVYAVSNGRAWVTWSKDGLNYTVGVNSELPDYSRVTKIDDSTGVVFTNAGEIHPRPPTK
jgi:hypothetical protein